MGASRRLLLLLFMATMLACATAPAPRTLAIDGGTIFVDDGGRGGVPIVFIHGNGGNARQWRAQLAYFRARGMRAVAIDLPGFGRSSLPAGGDSSLAAMARAIDRTADAIGLRRFVLAGHSYGGAVVATYAAAHPEKVAGVVYVDAAASRLAMPDEQKERVAAAIRADKMKVVRAWFAPMLKGSTPEVQEEVLASVESAPAEAFLAALLSLGAYDAKAVVDAYQGPRLAIAAADLESPLSFQRQFPEVPSVAISGTGHWVMLDNPEAVNRAIEAFVKGR